MTKERKAESKAEARILEIGWDTESTSETRKKAYRGSCVTPTMETPWCSNWHEVLKEVQKYEATKV